VWTRDIGGVKVFSVWRLCCHWNKLLTIPAHSRERERKKIGRRKKVSRELHADNAHKRDIFIGNLKQSKLRFLSCSNPTYTLAGFDPTTQSLLRRRRWYHYIDHAAGAKEWCLHKMSELKQV
jgi:hypothetical protein